jgi:hypothetical protein
MVGHRKKSNKIRYLRQSCRWLSSRTCSGAGYGEEPQNIRYPALSTSSGWSHLEATERRERTDCGLLLPLGRPLCAWPLLPYLTACRHVLTVCGRGPALPTWSAVLDNETRRGEQALRRTWGFAPLQAPGPRAGGVRCMRRAVGEVAGLAGLYARQHLAQGLGAAEGVMRSPYNTPTGSEERAPLWRSYLSGRSMPQCTVAVQGCGYVVNACAFDGAVYTSVVRGRDTGRRPVSCTT